VGVSEIIDILERNNDIFLLMHSLQLTDCTHTVQNCGSAFLLQQAISAKIIPNTLLFGFPDGMGTGRDSRAFS